MMKKIVYLILATLSVGAAGQAFAQSSGLTRAEVRQQLVTAEAQGLVPSSGTQYPPNARTIAHNRAVYAEQHEGDSAAQSAYGGATEGQHSN
jgi:hypothetical protein